MAEHTPHTRGPWQVLSEQGTEMIYEADQRNRPAKQIATVYADEAVDIANARLIAASPELLAALEMFRHGDCFCFANQGHHEYCHRALDAIAKARGES